jgi:hypothetical protein
MFLQKTWFAGLSVDGRILALFIVLWRIVGPSMIILVNVRN